MTEDRNAALEALEAAKWKGEPCPNPDKGWITDSRETVSLGSVIETPMASS